MAAFFERYCASQLARPHGLAGRFFWGAWLNRANRAMNETAFQLVAVEPGDRILEVGFGGAALFSDILAAKPEMAIGVELSEEMAARARRRFRRSIATGRAQILRGSVDRLPLRDDSVDKVCSLNTIYFWDDPLAAFREFARVIRPRGMLILGFDAAESLREWPGHRHGFALYEPSDVIRLATEAEFGNTRIHQRADPRIGKIYCLEFEAPA